MVKDSHFAEKWLLTLQTSDRGIIFLCNLACDFAAKRIGATEIEKFMGMIGDTNMFVDVRSDPFTRIDAATLADLLCKGPVPPAPPDPLTTIKRFDRTYFDLNFDARYFHGAAHNLDATELINLVGPDMRYARAGQQIRGQKPIVWLTSADVLDAIVQACAKDGQPHETASRVRDFLGLNHYSQDEFLVQILVPNTAIPDGHLHRPLAFDAGANLIFRTDVDARPNGYAVDLGTLGRGAYEVISPPIPIRPDFRLVQVGRLDRTPPSFKWAAIWADRDKLRKELELLFEEFQKLFATW
jgi:hypothetical protein